MEDEDLSFYQELCNVTNRLVDMLSMCDMPIIEYITDIVSNNGYAFEEDIITLSERNEEG